MSAHVHLHQTFDSDFDAGMSIIQHSNTNTLIILIFMPPGFELSIDYASIKSSLIHLISPSIPISIQKITDKPQLLSSGEIDRKHYCSTFAV